MPRSRVKIQEDVNIYRTGVEDKNLSLNDPMWDNKFDPRYLGIIKKRDEDALELKGFERELAEAKARGERGRSSVEIRKEISETQSKLNNYRSILNRATNPMQRMMSHTSVRFLQCNVNALQRELNEAIEDEME